MLKYSTLVLVSRPFYLVLSLSRTVGTHYQHLANNPAGGAVEAELERAVHPERGPVCSAHTHGPSAGRRWLSLVAHVRRARGVLHGPGQGVPGPGGQAQQVAGGHGRVQLPQSHRTLFLW